MTDQQPQGASDKELRGPLARRRAVRPQSLIGSLSIGKYGGLVIWAALLVAFAFWIPDQFFTVTTIKSIASEQAVTLLLSLGALTCFIAGVFDLSIAQNLGFCTVLCLKLIGQLHVNPTLAAVITLLVGIVVGAANAILVVGFGLDSFIATLGMQSVLLALTEIISGGVYAGPASPDFQKLAAWQPFGIPVLIIYALGFASILWYVLEHTMLGRRLAATGANPESSRLSGIRTKQYIGMSFVFAGATAGLCAILLSAKLGTVSPTIGPSYLLPVFAGCFLATTQIKPGRFNVGGLLIAIFLLATGVKGLQLASGQVWIPDLFNGLALILAVGLTVTLSRLQVRRAKERAEADVAAAQRGTAPASLS